MPQASSMSQPTTGSSTKESKKAAYLLPREHGATAMLITPMVCAAVLSRAWRWGELATFAAAFAALAVKDPLVVVARQRFVWTQRRPETDAAARSFFLWAAVLCVSGLVVLLTWPAWASMAMGLGLAAFSALAVTVNVKNRQRSILFQIASAAALTSSSLAISLSVKGTVQPWCWSLWLLLALQATSGILVVHSRLDARIALRSLAKARSDSRRAAQISIVVLVCVAIAAAAFGGYVIAFALLVASAGYAFDLHRQRDPQALQLPLSSVGQRALALSSLYAILLIIGLW